MFPVISGSRPGGKLLKTAQQIIYHTGDDGDVQGGLARPVYTVYSAGSPYSDTPNVDTPHYAGNDIAFVGGAPDTITSTTIDFTTAFKPADVIICIGSPNANNLVVRTIAAAGVATHTLTLTSSSALTNEAAGNYITIFKRVTPSGNVVYDETAKLYYLRYTTGGPVLKVGPASDGLLNWYDATRCYVLHAAGADLAMDANAKTITIVGGTAEATKFKLNTFLQFAGFTVANNNRAGGYRITSITPGASDLVIGLDTGYGVDGAQTGTTHNGTKVIDGLTNTSGLRIGMRIAGTNVGANSVIATIDSATQVTGTVNSTGSASNTMTFTTLSTEAAGGSRSIKIVAQDIFSYCAACNAVSLGGYTDWRIPEDMQLANLRRMGTTITGANQGNASPNSTAFPSWPTGNYVWSSTTSPITLSNAMIVYFSYCQVYNGVKTALYYCALVRGS